MKKKREKQYYIHFPHPITGDYLKDEANKGKWRSKAVSLEEYEKWKSNKPKS